jgi:hypothetical protein
MNRDISGQVLDLGARDSRYTCFVFRILIHHHVNPPIFDCSRIHFVFPDALFIERYVFSPFAFSDREVLTCQCKIRYIEIVFIAERCFQKRALSVRCYEASNCINTSRKGALVVILLTDLLESKRD